MRWGRFFGVLLTVLTASATVASPAAHAGAPVDDGGYGTVGSCPVVGQMQFKPALVNGGTSPVVVTLKLKPAKGSACSGGTDDGANVASVQLKGIGSSPVNNCLVTNGFFNGLQGENNFAETAKWKMTKGTTPKKVADTVIKTSWFYGGQTFPGGTTVPHGRFNTDNGSSVALKGSFWSIPPFEYVHHTLVTDQDLNEVNAACAGKGLKKLTFGMKASKDDLHLGSGNLSITPFP